MYTILFKYIQNLETSLKIATHIYLQIYRDHTTDTTLVISIVVVAMRIFFLFL